MNLYVFKMKIYKYIWSDINKELDPLPFDMHDLCYHLGRYPEKVHVLKT
jgi:hypothetical protein